MNLIVKALAATAALAVLASARPASACDAQQQKTTVTKAEEKAPPQKQAKSKENAKDAKAQQKQESAAQAKNDAGLARPEQR